MRVRIARVDLTLPLPVYASAGASAFDLFARLDVTVQPGHIARVPSNVIIAVPPGHTLIVALRSGVPSRHGLIMPNGVGVIDQDYCGPEDEIQIQVFNTGSGPVTVHRGERIAQGLLLPMVVAEWEEGGPLREVSRGGFGSTGSH